MQVSTYDNTISAREYLSYISECAGGFAFIGRDGKLYIRTIYQDEQQVSSELLGDFKLGDQCKITKVSYENGVESFKFGNDTGNNLWLNQENMYIVEEEQVEAIYNQLKDLIAYSFEGKMIIDPALDVGDKIIIDGKPIIYQGEADFQTRFVAEISSKIAIKQKQETTVKSTSQKVINRRVQSRIDEAEGKITQLVEENTEQSQKLTLVEQTVDGITQTVSSMETKVETVETKADNAQSTANIAQTTADEAKDDAESAITTANTANTTANEAKNTAETTNNNLTNNYYTKTETNSQINQKANEITSTVNQTYSTKEETTQAKQDAIDSANASTDEKLEDYSTTEEMNSAITQKADSITSEVSMTYSTKTETNTAKNEAVSEAEASTDEKLEDYTQTSKFGTLIEQNWEHVKIAWNQISQSIKLEGDNGNATMAFYDGNTKFAEMGVNTVDNDRYISFAIPCDYGNDIADGMAWGIQTTSDNKFWPILYIKNFHMASQNTGDFSGELVLTACNLALDGINSAITCGNVKMTTASVLGGIAYLDEETGSNLISITPQTILDDARIDILSNISFFKNQTGSNSLKVGNGNNNQYCMMTDDGSLSSYDLFVWEDATVLGEFINTSLKEMKKNIEELDNGLAEVLSTKIYSYNLKDESDNSKKHIGFIIGDDYSYSEKITSKKNDGANLYSMISVAFKAIQEQQKQIEKITKTLEVKNNE